MWWETYNISWIFCDHLKSSPYHHPISTVQVELVDEKAGSVYTVSFHQMILFGFSRFCVKWSQPMYYIVWFLWISDICQTSLCFSTKVQDYDPYRSWAGSQYGRWELPTSKSKWATWVRISQIYLHWSTWIKVNSGVEAEFKRTPDDGEIKWKRKSSDQCFPLSFDFWPGCYCRKW